MIVLHLRLDRIYGFDNFEIDFTYPKKIVGSLIGNEHLAGRERFRYRKAIILMGANATGKTSLGKCRENTEEWSAANKAFCTGIINVRN